MLFWQILIDGFAISSLYALGATGFTLIFGVTGVLNLSHGAIMVAAAVAAWAVSGDFGAGAYLGAVFGVVVALLLALATYYLIVRRLQLSRAVREEEKEIFILTATLLWGIMIQEAIAYLFTNNAKTVLPIVDGLKMKTAVIMSEDAAWTGPLDAGYEACLPKIGLKVLDHIRFSPDTTDFTPIFNKIEASKPDVIITGVSHVGTQPTVQWKSQQVPIPMFGIASQATNSTFWKDTNGATDSVIYQGVSGPGVAVTPKTLPFVDAFNKKYGNMPSYAGYTAYDDVYIIADAIKRAGSLDSDKLVDAMEKTDYVGTIGRVQFLPKGDPHVHGLKTGEGLITGLMLQWQDGKQVNMWPATLANGKLEFPPFVKIASGRN
jgi:Periplasmic binding protein/Branched-chain amino acid transport system / permease component